MIDRERIKETKESLNADKKQQFETKLKLDIWPNMPDIA